MATFEPWLTNLLNTPDTAESLPTESVPRGAPASESVTLPPIGFEFESIQRSERPAATDIASLCVVDAQSLDNPVARASGFPGRRDVTIPPIQSLLEPKSSAPEPSAPMLPIRSIVNDVPGGPEEHPDKKRHRTASGKEDLVQLPKLPKKRKSAQQMVPPMIPGLREPPPNNMILPPILSSSNEAYSFAPWKELGSGTEDRPLPPGVAEAQPSKPLKQKRRPMKPRRKWTQEETDNLLLGVKQHGVGNWTSILNDERFKFNNRTAGDLKDRFRTCLPDELRRATAEGGPADGNCTPTGASQQTARPKNGLPLGDILVPTGDPLSEHDAASPSAPPDSDAAPKQRRARAHRKTQEDLAKLGISGPFERSHRRARRPFSPEDDQNILAGFYQYGPSWTKIQRDPKFNLSSRQPTDLRDRLRNKYPDIYASMEKHHPKEAPQMKGDTLQPSVDPVRDSLPSLESQLNRSGSRESLYGRTMTPSGYESTESLPALADVILDKYDASMVSCYMGAMPDMDMGNLMLDDSNPFDVGERRFFARTGDAPSCPSGPRGVAP
ncbi:hypothetical protein VTI74DRAFT_2035 [Chaetomium olivicolor]